MEAKFYKWIAPFSEEDTIDQVVMIYSGTSCRVNDFGKNQKIEYHDFEVNTDDMEPATKEEFIRVYMKVYSDTLKRTLDVF